jgi:hypothetical protein
MKRNVWKLLSVFAISALVIPSALADDLSALSGKWVATRNDDQGRSAKQVLEIKQNKFTFQVLREEQIALFAEGEVKAEPAGSLSIARFFNIRGGSSAADLQPVDDERTIVYKLDNEELFVAVNFDKGRSEAPTVTRYTKVAGDTPKSLVIDKIVMHQTPQSMEWFFCFEATVGGVTKRFNVPNKGYEKTEVTIPTELTIPDVRKDQACKFVLKLDDVAGDECTEEMDNRSAGEFAATESGSKTFKPEDQWSYTIYWHLK